MACLSTALLSVPTRGVAAEPVESRPRTVYFRGTAWQDAVAEFAAGENVAYTLERSITPDTRSRPVRLNVEYLTGEQVLRWLARLGDVGVVRVGDRYVFGRPEAWPSAWRVRAAGSWSTGGGGQAEQESIRRREVLETRVADIEWSDQTLGAALAEIRAKYHVDVIVDPVVLGHAELLTIARRQVRLAELVAEIGKAWRATWSYEDGAVALGDEAWVARLASGAGFAAWSPTREPGGSPDASIPRPRWWAGWIRVEAKERSWKKALWPMMQLMGAEATWQANESPRPRIADSDVLAEGKTGEVLEGLKLLGYLRWQRPMVGASAGAVEIRLQ